MLFLGKGETLPRIKFAKQGIGNGEKMFKEQVNISMSELSNLASGNDILALLRKVALLRTTFLIQILTL